jgi:predicted enzyme related to lactoylglutathione lyase
VEEDEMTTQTGIKIKAVRTVAVPVTNHDRALEFYLEKLGFEKRLDASFGQGQRWVEVAPSGSWTTIALAPPGRAEFTGGHDTGIRLSSADAASDHARLQASGVDVDADVLRIPGVPPMFSFRDPDGNQLYVVEETSAR